MSTATTESSTGTPSEQDDRFRTAGRFLIFGAAGGIGSSVTTALMKRRASCMLIGRDSARLQEMCSDTGCLVQTADATHFDSVDECFSRAAEDGMPIAGVVNCVGSILLKPAHLTSLDEWNAVISQNLTSAFAISRAAGRQMKKGGSVVLFSSVAAHVGLANHEGIAAAKGGVAALVRSAAASYASRGLRFNAISPGLVQTPLTEQLTANERNAEAVRRMHPMNRLGEPRDIADAAIWLLDPATTWVTGQTISIDGGMSTVRPRGG